MTAILRALLTPLNWLLARGDAYLCARQQRATGWVEDE